MSRAKFRARITIEEDDLQEIEIWDDELSPFGKDGRCSIREWVKNHFDDYSNQDLREWFELPATGNYEVLLEGTIVGTESYYGEYDEDVTIDKIQSQLILEQEQTNDERD